VQEPAITSKEATAKQRVAVLNFDSCSFRSVQRTRHSAARPVPRD
jgi:hypothetical protein